MKYFRMTLYIAAFTAANLICGAAGYQPCAAQPPVRVAKQGVDSSQTQEPKGEVDLLLEDLKKQNETVLRHCIENCPESEAAGDTQVKTGRSVDRVMPEYPASARAARVSGAVVVLVLIDETGNVIAAQSVSGHPLLQSASVAAARQSTFTPTQVDDKPVKVLATITYRFVMQ